MDNQNGRTFAHVPAQMAEPVQRMEGERSGEDDLARVLDSLGEAREQLDDMGGIERRGRDEIRERVPVQYCTSTLAAMGGQTQKESTYGRSTLRR